MPMIDVYAAEATFSDTHSLARDLAAAVMRWEQVPALPLFSRNTAAFVHELPNSAIANVDGESNYVCVQVLTPIGVLDRDKQLGVVRELTEIVTAAATDPGSPSARGCCSPSRPRTVRVLQDTPTSAPTSQPKHAACSRAAPRRRRVRSGDGTSLVASFQSATKRGRRRRCPVTLLVVMRTGELCGATGVPLRPAKCTTAQARSAETPANRGVSPTR